MEKLIAVFERVDEIKREHGRYTLEDAALFISEQTGEQAEGIKNKLIAAVEKRELATYAPGSFVKNDSKIIRDFYECVYWDDLNDWLKKNEPRLDCEFPAPNFQDKKFYTDEANRNGGRYQLAVAAMFMANHANAGVDSMTRKLFEAAGAGELIVYERGMDEVYRFTPDWKSNSPLKDSEAFLEAKWNDLNAWLKKKEPGIFEAYQFPEPDAPAASEQGGHDITAERGCRRFILENWDKIKKLHGDKADGRQVLGVLNIHMDKNEERPKLKTVQNKLGELRNEGLIP